MNTLPVLYNDLVIGNTYQVGESFWIEDGIGFTPDAYHGHGFDHIRWKSPGSADTNCTVRVLDVTSDRSEDRMAILVLIRPEIPYGAPAPHGTIFRLPAKDVMSWARLAEESRMAEKVRQSTINDLNQKYGTVMAGPIESSTMVQVQDDDLVDDLDDCRDDPEDDRV